MGHRFTVSTTTTTRRPAQTRAWVAGSAGLVALAAIAAFQSGPRQAALALIGFFAGVALYHAAFGFTSAWRNLLAERRSAGVRAQLVMIATTIVVSFPLLDAGSVGGSPISGFVNPVGFALGLGAFLFGIGMQLGGGCGSGTLWAAGGGSRRMLVTLAAFIAGSVLATANPLDWMNWPAMPGLSLVEMAGVPGSLAIAGVILSTAFFLAWRTEYRVYGSVEPLRHRGSPNLLRGPWPLMAGALALALVNIATLIVAGRPWGITAAFALWGAKVLSSVGVDVAGWPYWSGNPALEASLWTDVTTVMNIGIMLGALVASGAAGRFAPVSPLPPGSLLAAVAGGLLMGFGARLATGCNIGAFFSGTISGSLHGIVWLAFAVPGNWIGLRLRPFFHLDGR